MGNGFKKNEIKDVNTLNEIKDEPNINLIHLICEHINLELMEPSLFLEINNFIGNEYEVLKVYLECRKANKVLNNLCLYIYNELSKTHKLKYFIETEEKVKISYSKNLWKGEEVELDADEFRITAYFPFYGYFAIYGPDQYAKTVHKMLNFG